MKTIKNILIAFSILTLFINTSFGYDVSEVNVVDDKTINLSLDADLEFAKGEQDGEVRILKDLEVDFSIRDLKDNKKVSVSLKQALEANKSYSLLSVSGTDGSIDFKVSDNMEGEEILNPEASVDGQNISKIVILNENSIDVYFKEVLEETEFDFKILKELKGSSISSTDQKTIDINLEDKLTKDSDYIIMFISLKDSLGKEIMFDSGIYDFNIGLELAEHKDILENADLGIENQDNLIDDTNNGLENIDLGIENTDLGTEDKGNIEELSLNSASTPDTGPETWVLILGTFLISSYVHIRKRVSKI